MRLVYLFVLMVTVGLFLFLRKCADRKVEKITGKDVVREGEELLGTWASKSKDVFLQFRLKRDGTLDYLLVQLPANDTTKIKGTYVIAGAGGGNSINYFPRIYGFNEKSDTIFNYYVRYVTPYGSTIDKYDRLILSDKSIYDTLEYKFFRIKQ